MHRGWFVGEWDGACCFQRSSEGVGMSWCFLSQSLLRLLTFNQMCYSKVFTFWWDEAVDLGSRGHEMCYEMRYFLWCACCSYPLKSDFYMLQMICRWDQKVSAWKGFYLLKTVKIPLTFSLLYDLGHHTSWIHPSYQSLLYELKERLILCIIAEEMLSEISFNVHHFEQYYYLLYAFHVIMPDWLRRVVSWATGLVVRAVLTI